MRRLPVTIKKRSNCNVNQLLEIGKKFRVLSRSGLYHWDLVSDKYGISKFHQGSTRPLQRDEIITYAGQEDGKPLFRTTENYLGIFRPLNSGLIPSETLEPIHD